MLARALLQHAQGMFQKQLLHFIAFFTQAYAAGELIVQKQGRQIGLRRLDLVDHFDIARCAHQINGRNDAQQVGNANQSTLQIVIPVCLRDARWHSPPHANGVHVGFRQHDGTKAKVFMSIELHFFEDLHNGGNL